MLPGGEKERKAKSQSPSRVPPKKKKTKGERKFPDLFGRRIIPMESEGKRKEKKKKKKPRKEASTVLRGQVQRKGRDPRKKTISSPAPVKEGKKEPKNKKKRRRGEAIP